MDRRQQKTQDAIFAAFTHLLSIKNYTKITVQEIIDEANIGRSTFYAHFETKDDLLKSLCNDLFNHIFSESLDTENTHDFSIVPYDTYAMITHILYHLRDNKKNILALLSCENNELFLSYFKKYLRKMIIDYILCNINHNNTTVPEDFLINHITCSFMGMIQWWTDNGLKDTPENLAKYFESVIIPII